MLKSNFLFLICEKLLELRQSDEEFHHRYFAIIVEVRSFEEKVDFFHDVIFFETSFVSKRFKEFGAFKNCHRFVSVRVHFVEHGEKIGPEFDEFVLVELP